MRVTIPFSDHKLLKNLAVVRSFNYGAEVKDFENGDRNLSKLPESMSKNLYDFQKKGIEFGVKKFGRMILGDEMGVGKTIQAIGI